MILVLEVTRGGYYSILHLVGKRIKDKKKEEEERVNKSQYTFIDNGTISNAALKNLHHRFMESCILPTYDNNKKKVAHPFTIATWNRGSSLHGIMTTLTTKKKKADIQKKKDVTSLHIALWTLAHLQKKKKSDTSLHGSMTTYQKKRIRKKVVQGLRDSRLLAKKKNMKNKKVTRVKTYRRLKKKKSHAKTGCSYVVIPHAKTTFVNIPSLLFTKHAESSTSPMYYMRIDHSTFSHERQAESSTSYYDLITSLAESSTSPMPMPTSIQVLYAN
ncbi:hypothetical protein H8356DRAFT_1352186 [Neocallimastix lanati (nom. inval.)]|nr:hypothetical protein H8356DRAFT_1352186 [Neocallimastix sp. JGI-2020a]